MSYIVAVDYQEMNIVSHFETESDAIQFIHKNLNTMLKKYRDEHNGNMPTWAYRVKLFRYFGADVNVSSGRLVVSTTRSGVEPTSLEDMGR